MVKDTNIHIKSTEQIGEVTVARCIAVLAVVFGHVTCIYRAGVWGLELDTPLKSIFPYYVRYAPTMQLFTFIAGYLFAYLMSTGHYQSNKQFVKSKIQRLLIPYFVLGTIVIFIQPGLNMFKDLFYGHAGHMWYCLMLFYCYLICYFTEKYLGKTCNAIFAVCSLGVTTRFINWGALIYGPCHWLGGIEIAIYFYFFFYLGYVLYRQREYVFSGNYAIIIALLILVLPKGSIFRSVGFILFAFIAAKGILKATDEGGFAQKIIRAIARYSFGIYVFHHIILWDLVHIPSCAQLVVPFIEEHYIISPILLFVFAMGLSMVLTWLCQKTKVGKYLLA